LLDSAKTQDEPENNKKGKGSEEAKAASAKDSKKVTPTKAEEKSALVDSPKTKARMDQIDNTIFNMK